MKINVRLLMDEISLKEAIHFDGIIKFDKLKTIVIEAIHQIYATE